MFDHVKCLKDRTTFSCHVCNSKQCKVLTIAYCDMQFKSGASHTIFWKKLDYFIVENEVPNVNFKHFMANITWVNWNAAPDFTQTSSGALWKEEGNGCNANTYKMCLDFFAKWISRMTSSYEWGNASFWACRCACTRVVMLVNFLYYYPWISLHDKCTIFSLFWSAFTILASYYKWHTTFDC